MGSEEIVHVPTDKPGMVNGKIGRRKWSEWEATFRRSSRLRRERLRPQKVRQYQVLDGSSKLPRSRDRYPCSIRNVRLMRGWCCRVLCQPAAGEFCCMRLATPAYGCRCSTCVAISGQNSRNTFVSASRPIAYPYFEANPPRVRVWLG